jgi:predicted nucleic acid-binding protein
MMVFVDTSAYYAFLDADDDEHPRSYAVWAELLAGGDSLVTSNYVLVETMALAQRRLGIEAVRLFEGEVTPLLQVVWVDAEIHQRATAALLAAGRRQLSLVDCVSFVVMRAYGLDTAFAFDPHFAEQGLTVIPQTP